MSRSGAGSSLTGGTLSTPRPANSFPSSIPSSFVTVPVAAVTTIASGELAASPLSLLSLLTTSGLWAASPQISRIRVVLTVFHGQFGVRVGVFPYVLCVFCLFCVVFVPHRSTAPDPRSRLSRP
ncbi:hypothetical protein ColTof4_01302 [Colletotrichum tofieldiae]|nr:hypothetical protein ColTof4_01302 [Colletotrichum tofieldiae]